MPKRAGKTTSIKSPVSKSALGDFVKERAYGPGTSILTSTTPKIEARWAEEKSKKQEWLLRRLDRIEKRNQTRGVYLSDVRDLQREAELARESIKAGDICNNKHFRHVQQINENLESLIEMSRIDDLRLKGLAGAKRKESQGHETRERVEAMARAVWRDLPDESDDKRIRKEMNRRLKRDLSGPPITTKNIRKYYPSRNTELPTG